MDRQWKWKVLQMDLQIKIWRDNFVKAGSIKK